MNKYTKRLFASFVLALAMFSIAGDRCTIPDNTAEVLEIAAEVQSHYFDVANNDLSGYCLTASKELQSRLTAAGIASELHRGYYCLDGERLNHWWLVVDDRILDITSCQFTCDPTVGFVPESELGLYEED